MALKWGGALGGLALAATLGAHPLGKGVFNAGLDFLVAGKYQKGSYQSGAATIEINATKPPAQIWDLGLQLPLNRSLGVELSGVFGSRADEVKAEAMPPYRGEMDLVATDAVRVLKAGLLFWPSDLFGVSFENGADGNPDGPLLWPVLTAEGQWQADEIEGDVITHSGGFSGITAPEPQHSDRFIGAYTLRLPVTRRFSLFGGYGREYSLNVTERSTLLYHSGGDSEFLGGGATIFAAWDNQADLSDPDDYFPLMGWPGQYRVELGYTRELHVPSGRIRNQSGELRVDAPFNRLVAFNAAYGVDVTDKTTLEGFAGLSSISSSNVSHHMRLGLSFSLRGLGWF
jgi:hypothetical protein